MFRWFFTTAIGVWEAVDEFISIDRWLLEQSEAEPTLSSIIAQLFGYEIRQRHILTGNQQA